MNRYCNIDRRDPNFDPEVEQQSIDELVEKQAEVTEELWREEKTKMEYTMLIAEQDMKKVFDNETYKIFEENNRLKCENADLKKRLDVLNIRNEIINDWSFHYYMSKSKTTNPTDYVLNTDNKDVFNHYISLIKRCGYELVDEVIGAMLKEALEEQTDECTSN